MKHIQSVVIYGPELSLKNADIESLRKFFKMRFIVDHGRWLGAWPTYDVLTLTHEKLKGDRWSRVFHIKTALRMMNGKKPKIVHKMRRFWWTGCRFRRMREGMDPIPASHYWKDVTCKNCLKEKN